MTERLSLGLKEERRIVRRWANIMRPIAERHSGDSWREEGELRERYTDNKTKVSFTNLENLDMSADYGYKESEFIYTRTIAPFDSETEDYKNRNLAAKVIAQVSDCVEAFGFGFGILNAHHMLCECKTPAVSFWGNSNPDKFNDYIRLVEMAETLIEGVLLSVEQNRKRPFKYIIVKHPRASSDATLFPLKDKEDLVNALGIFETSRELDLRENPMMMYCGVDKLNLLERIFSKYYGRVVSVNDYLAGKR